MALNNRLANERTKNSKDLLVSLFPQFKPENIRVESRANDWSGMILILRRDNSIRNRDIILKILTDPSITNKDAAVRRHPQAYAEIRDGLFDNMRTASISISVVKTATNLDEFVAEPELFITSKSPMQLAADGGNGTISLVKEHTGGMTGFFCHIGGISGLGSFGDLGVGFLLAVLFLTAGCKHCCDQDDGHHGQECFFCMFHKNPSE